MGCGGTMSQWSPFRVYSSTHLQCVFHYMFISGVSNKIYMQLKATLVFPLSRLRLTSSCGSDFWGDEKGLWYICACSYLGWNKIFALWEPHLLGQYSVIYGFTKSFTSLCHKKSFSAREDYFQPKENISCNNKLSPNSRNIMSCHKKLLFPFFDIDYLFCKWFPVDLFPWEEKKSYTRKYFFCD